MRTYAVRTGCIAPEKISLFEKIISDFEAIPDMNPVEKTTCHAVCRALAKKYEKASFVDGWFSKRGHDHSWLDLGEGIIVDVYPIAGIGPFLVDASHFMVPWHHLYIPHPTLLDEGGRDRAHHEKVAEEIFALLS